MLESGGDDVGSLDASDSPELIAALGAGFDIDGEDSLQATHPGHGRERLVAGILPAFAFRFDLHAVFPARSKHTEEAGEVQALARRENCEPSDEL